MAQIKISVVVPTYKRPELLRKCLDQLFNQTLEKELYEIIIVSDGPDDVSKEVANDVLFSKMRFLSLPSKKGPAAARNLGWQSAKGTLIAFTDDDCLPCENWLQNIAESYKKQKEIAYTGKVVVPVTGQPTDFELNTKGLEKGEFVTANCIITKAALQTITGFDEAFTSAWREDSDIHFKLLTANIPIIKVNEAIVVHPVRKAPWGVSIKEQKKTMYNALLYKKHRTLYRLRIKSSPAWRYYFTVLFFLIFLVSAFFKINWLSLMALASWIFLATAFIVKRLSATRKTGSHIFEMIVTSLIIPFLSVYWTLYGSIKYRVLFF